MEDMTEHIKRIDEKAWALIAQIEAMPPDTSKPIRHRRTSLDEAVNTKEKADKLMREIKYLEELQRKKEEGLSM